MTTSQDNTTKPRLTVAMIVRDEQDTLAASIESVKGIADEIVVVDLGSTDETMPIALRSGAMVNHYGWENDYSAARNQSLRLAEGDWILWLDAGEQLAEEAADTVRYFVDHSAEKQNVYRMAVQMPRDERSAGEQVAQVRLIPNNRELCFEGRVRETLLPSVELAGLSVDMAPGLIVCHARRLDPRWRGERAALDLQLTGLEVADNQRPSARTWLAAGEAQAELGRQLLARESFCKAIATASRGSTEMLEGYYGLLTSCDGDPNEQDRQLSVCLEALEIFPVDAQLLLAMGNYLQMRQQWDLAIRSFQTAVKHGQVDVGAWHLMELGEVAVSCLSLCQQAKGSDTDALKTLGEGIARYGNSPRLLRHLLDLQIKHARGDDALATAEKLVADVKQREALALAIRGACKAAEEDWTAALGLLQSAYAAGCREILCLRWLAVVLLSNGQTEAAMPVLQEWETIEPGNAELRRYREMLAEPAVGDDSDTEPPEPTADGHVYRVDQGTETTSPSSVQSPKMAPDKSKNSLSTEE